jgi:hypothetical protein
MEFAMVIPLRKWNHERSALIRLFIDGFPKVEGVFFVFPGVGLVYAGAAAAVTLDDEIKIQLQAQKRLRSLTQLY